MRAIYTLGHSTLAIEVFLRVLEENGVRQVVDIRTVPRSRHNPQFEREALAKSLRDVGIEYRWLRELGGLRHARKDSINTGWRNASFRGYADYMQTADFTAALERLIELAQERQTAILCAEAVPWRCHRSLVADALAARGVAVEDITYDAKGKSHRAAHRLTPFARREGTRVWYPAESDLFAVEHPPESPAR